ncbi:MAG: 4Fe-4S binding protein, partial [Clostridia bacterium]|nr:4Fe-4S binding protein [Clostridia bacterium]
EGDDTFLIDPEACTDCGTCLDVCPHEGAIVRD